MDELQTKLRGLLLNRTPSPMEELDERAQRIYRRQVRRSLMKGVRIALPITRRLLDDEQLTALIARWLEESPPTTRLYWRLPLEFGEWLREQPDLPHPAAGELVHWESILLDVKNAPESDVDAAFDEPAPHRHIILDPSARLGIYHYPVFRMTRSDDAWPEPGSTPTFLIAFRRDEKPYWRILSTEIAQLLAHTFDGKPISAGLAFLKELYGRVDEAAITEELTTLAERRILLGFSDP